jgi:hypothetical protein
LQDNRRLNPQTLQSPTLDKRRKHPKISEDQLTSRTTSEVPATVNEAGLDRPATSDHSEGGADSLALGGSSASDPTAPRNSGESSDNAPAAVGSIVDSDPPILTRLLLIFSDLRAQVFGGS